MLEYLSKKSHATLSRIHHDLEIAKSSAYGILTTLEYRGYIRKDVNNEYRLGLKLYELGNMSLEHVDFIKEAVPIMEELANNTGLTCNLGVLEGNVGVYLEKVDAPSLIRLNSWKGKRIPLHCTALGKVFLAYKNNQEIHEFFKNDRYLEKFTEYTIIDKDKLQEELVSVKEQGYAIDFQGHEMDITCVAAPVFDHTKSPIAALSLSGLSNWLEPNKLKEVIEHLKLGGIKLSKKIGG